MMHYRAEATIDRGAGTMQRQGERLLLLATLEDGIRTILEGAKRGAPARCIADDVAWLTSDDRVGPFSFLNLCDFLGIDAEYLRARVLTRYLRRAPVHAGRGH